MITQRKPCGLYLAVPQFSSSTRYLTSSGISRSSYGILEWQIGRQFLTLQNWFDGEQVNWDKLFSVNIWVSYYVLVAFAMDLFISNESEQGHPILVLHVLCQATDDWDTHDEWRRKEIYEPWDIVEAFNPWWCTTASTWNLKSLTNFSIFVANTVRGSYSNDEQLPIPPSFQPLKMILMMTNINIYAIGTPWRNGSNFFVMYQSGLLNLTLAKK